MPALRRFAIPPPFQLVMSRRLIFDYIICYTLWLVFSAIAMWLVFVWHGIVVTVGFRTGLNPWQLRAVDTWATFLLGLAWLASIILTEAYFRKGVPLGILWQRVARTFALVGLVTLLALLLDRLL